MALEHARPDEKLEEKKMRLAEDELRLAQYRLALDQARLKFEEAKWQQKVEDEKREKEMNNNLMMAMLDKLMSK